MFTFVDRFDLDDESSASRFGRVYDAVNTGAVAVTSSAPFDDAESVSSEMDGTGEVMPSAVAEYADLGLGYTPVYTAPLKTSEKEMYGNTLSSEQRRRREATYFEDPLHGWSTISDVRTTAAHCNLRLCVCLSVCLSVCHVGHHLWLLMCTCVTRCAGAAS